MPSVLWIFFLSLAGVAADFFMKLAGQGTKTFHLKWLVIAVICYAVTLPCTFLAIKYTKLASFGVIYSLSTFLLLAALGLFYFHEKMNISELAGVVLAIISVFLLARFA